MHHVCNHNTDYYFSYGHCPPNSPLVPNGTPWWDWLILGLGLLAILVVLANGVRIVQAYENGVIFRLGKYKRMVGPGLQFFLPFIDKMVRVSTQIETIELDKQEVITKDSVSLTIEAVVYYKVTDAADSIINVDDVENAIERLALAIMRRVIGKNKLDEVLTHSESVDTAIVRELESATNDWGVQIDRIELQDIGLPKDMKRAMASVAEAAREAEAKVLESEGEVRSAANLQKAAEMLNPTALELRRLATWREIGTDNSTIIVVAPDGTGIAAAAAAAGAKAAGQTA